MSASEDEDVEVEVDDEPEEDSDEQPEIEDDELAEWEAVGDSVDEDPDEDDDEQDDDEDTADSTGMDEFDPSRTSIGDVYCNALGMGAAVARDRYGDLDDERTAAMDEYADMARQLDIDDYVDDWMEEQGGIDELSPGQGAMVMSVVFAVMVAVEDPALAENAIGEVGA